MRWHSLLLSLAACALAGVLPAEPLPDPLTLEHALILSQQTHPVLQAATADMERAQAQLEGADAITGTRISFEGRLQAIEPPAPFDEIDSNNDSSAVLSLEKRLYDFGHSEASRQAASLELEGSEWRQLDVRQKRHIAVLKAFFDVILADLEFAHHNEAMATAYVSMDRIRDRQELGQASDIDLLEKENRYQQARHKRFASEARQRAMRSRLAIALNRPSELPSNLVTPAAPDTSALPLTVEDLTQEVLADNPRLKGLRAEVNAANQGIQQAKTRYGPVIRGELAAAEYNRVTRSTFPLRAALVFEMPLYTGGLSGAGVAEATAEAHEKQALLAQAELGLRQSVLDLWLELETLRIQMEQINTLDDYRDLYLDRSRTLYELEVTADLGDAMVQTSEVRVRRAEVQFKWMLARAKLDALRGKLLAEPIEEVQ